MTNERLKEIKDSIGLQAKVMQIKHLDTTIIDEELELYNEVIRLREENEKIRKQNMYEHKYGSDMEGKYIVEKTKNDKAVKYIERTQEGFISELKLLDILKGEQ